MKKSMFALLALFASSSVLADPPEWCNEGAVFEGSATYQGSDFESLPEVSADYLKVVAPRYVLINSEITVKGDGMYWFSRGDDIRFYDTIVGYRGFDESNSEGNAYITYRAKSNSAFSAQSHDGWVWAEKKGEYPHIGCQGDGDLCKNDRYQKWVQRYFTGQWCSKQKVNFQTAPRVTHKQIDISYGTNGRANINAAVSGAYDYYSKKGRSGENTPVTVEWKARSLCFTNSGPYRCPVVDDLAPWRILGVSQNGANFSTAFVSGEHELVAVLNDGSFKTEVKFRIGEYDDGTGSGGSPGTGGGSTNPGNGGTCTRGICSEEP
jgi:hypothetical protein